MARFDNLRKAPDGPHQLSQEQLQQRSDDQCYVGLLLLSSFTLALKLFPVLKLVFMNLDVKLHDPGLKSLLRIGYASVVDGRTDFLKKEPQ